jgi:hypothetical protein
MKYKRIDNFARLCFCPVHKWMIIGMSVVLLNTKGTDFGIRLLKTSKSCVPSIWVVLATLVVVWPPT